jgi:WD40 repeat protein
MIAAVNGAVPSLRDVQVWNTQTGQPAGPPIIHDDEVSLAALNPDGARVVTATATRVRSWDARTGAPVGNPINFSESVSSIAYSPDGKRLAIAAGTTAMIVDSGTLLPLGSAFQSRLPISRIAFVPDGQQVLVVADLPEEKNEDEDADSSSQSDSPSTSQKVKHEAWLQDVQTGTPDDAPVLAALAELLGGFRINGLGALEPVRKRSPQTVLQRSQKDRRAAASSRMAAWLLSDDRARDTGEPARRAAAPGGGAR